MKRFLILFVLLFSSACQTPWFKLKLENDQLYQENQDLEALVAELRSEIDKAGLQIDETKGQLKKIREREEQRQRELEALQSQLQGTGIEAKIENGQTILTLPGRILFAPGKHKLSSEGLKSLATVIKVLNEKYSETKISVEGHTDSDPIVKSKKFYKDNYQLSAERARSVLLYLEQNGISSSRLHGAFYGSNQPRASNKSSSGKKKNRRVEIVLHQ
jgi:chemotaxis protein MotB